MYTNKVDTHQARKEAERLGKDLDKASKAEAKTIAQALSSGESTSTSTTQPKAKATDKPEKANLAGPKNNNNKASTLAAHAKSQFGLDLTEVSFLVPLNKYNEYYFLQNLFITY